MDKLKFFEEQVKYWTKKVGLLYFPVISDKRITKYLAYSYVVPQNKIKYSPEHVLNCTKNQIIQCVLHELGHIKTCNKNWKNIPQWKREYKAEKFALKTIRKYILNYYKKAIKDTKEYVTRFSKTKEKWQLPYIKGFGKLIQELENER